VYRDQADLELLAELAGILDRTVTDAGLSAGQYLVLRELARAEGPHEITGLAAAMKASPEEIADLAGRLVAGGLAETRPNGVAATESGAARAAELDEQANEAMRAYVVDRPHTATVYGLVASMQAGRFTVEDLIEFLAEGADE
jgi:DNA-binding MarR family transcriptional regulator